MSKKMDFTSGKTKKATHMPLWILKLKGRLDGRKGQGLCDEYIFTLLKKEEAIEASEVMQAERALASVRKQAAGILVSNSEKANSNSKIIIEKAESVQAIRANRANRTVHDANVRAMNNGVLTLAEIHETIVFIETILEERIEKLRSETKRVCHAYVSGIKAGKFKDYAMPFKEYDNKAVNIYKDKHKELDLKIYDAVNINNKE